MKLKIDYIEDWSSGSCVNGEHGPNACLTDRYQLCAQHDSALKTSEVWDFIHCNFQYQACLSYNKPTTGLPATCTLEGVVSGCSKYTSYQGGFDAMKTCATSTASATWAAASGNATAVVAGGHPLWLFVDDTKITDDSYGTDYWAQSVLKGICSAAKTKGLKLPAPCQSSTPLVTPL